MGKRTLFTNITPLPSSVTREVAIAMLHDHNEMIELNPMVIEHHPIKAPRDASADEFLDCAWQELTDKVHYLPGGLVKGKVSYKACFHDLPSGLQTHIYAPTGLDIREKWSICGTLPGEPPVPRELGSTAPAVGLYLKEEGEMRCNRFLSSFVRKNLDEAHRVLVERILRKAQLIEQHRTTVAGRTISASSATSARDYFDRNPPEKAYGNGFQVGGHMSHSKILQSPTLQSPSSQTPISPLNYYPRAQAPHSPITATQHSPAPNLADHPAFRHDPTPPTTYTNTTNSAPSAAHNRSWSTHETSTSTNTQYFRPNHTQSHSISHPTPSSKNFVAELPGSIVPDPQPQTQLRKPDPADARFSMLSEMSSDLAPGGTDRGSVVSDMSPTTGPGQGQGGYEYNPRDFQR